MNEQLLTVEELAKELKVPVSWVYSRTRQRGEAGIPVIQCGKYCRFRFEDVMAWLKNQGGEIDE